MNFFSGEDERVARFPIAGRGIFLGHAGVTALPRCAADAMKAHIEASCEAHQEFGDVLRDIAAARSVCASSIGAHVDEIALLGPTSLGLSLFANGLDWKPGDELVCHGDDYPANVYPWAAVADRGVVVKRLRASVPGRITPDLVEEALTPRTRLVTLASCHFLTGWMIDVAAIGTMLRRRGILFCVDGIQSVGAAPFDVESVDFLSADAHKWMLGPMAIGIVYVAKRNFEACRPTLLGSWNVVSPDFVAQETITFEKSARRYEPGVLNIAGMYGMKASLEMLLGVGLERVHAGILDVRDHLHSLLGERGFEFASPGIGDPARSGILTARDPRRDSADLSRKLESGGVTASLRSFRDGTKWLRFSPHFYNTRQEMERVAALLDPA